MGMTGVCLPESRFILSSIANELIGSRPDLLRGDIIELNLSSLFTNNGGRNEGPGWFSGSRWGRRYVQALQ